MYDVHVPALSRFLFVSFNFYISFSYNNLFIGLLKLEPGTILFARPLCKDGVYLEEHDIVVSWCLDGYVCWSFHIAKIQVILRHATKYGNEVL